MRLDASGRLLVGTSTSLSTDRLLQIADTGGEAGSEIIRYTDTQTGAPVLALSKSRGTSVGVDATVSDNDILGYIQFKGNTGTGFLNAAWITGEVDGEPNTGGDTTDMPGRLVFSTTADGASSSTERMRINNQGIASFSTNIPDSARYNAGSYHCLHTSVGDTISLAVENSHNSSPYGMLIDFSDAAPDNNGNYFFKCIDNAANRFFVYSDGDVQNHDNSYTGISDEKLKQDIVDAGSQWDDLKNLRVRKFKFISDVEAYGDNAKTLIGVVAQEVETVSPGLVKEHPDLDNENNDLGTTTKSVNYSVLYMKAVKALQEAMERIETLEAKVAALEAQ
jgi:hypothetical protein